MNNIKQLLSSIDLNDLLKIFDLQIAIAVLLFFMIFKNIFSRIIIKIFYKVFKIKKNPKESSMYGSFNRFFVLLGIFLMLHVLIQDKETNQQIMYIINKIFKLICIYYTIKLLTKCINEDSIFMKKAFRDPTNKTVNKFLCQVVKAVLWIIYIFIFIAECGYDLSGVLTALGIGSAAIALAAQDLVKSLISGATILTDKPFVIGDWIEVGEYQGTVIDITFRSIRIKAYSNAVITIPNSTITSTYVVNWNRLTSRRFETILRLSLDTQSEKIKKIIKQIKIVLQNNPKVIKETVQVSFDEITEYSNNIKMFLYVAEADFNKYIMLKQEILCSILLLLEQENIDLAYPTQSLYLKKGDYENE